jgi:hypothetical protein
MEKDGSGEPAGKDAELDALLSAVDGGMLEAIRGNLDLDTGFAQILGDLAGITPAGRPTGSAEAEPGGRAHGHDHALDPVPACEVPSAAPKIAASAGPKNHTGSRYPHRALIMLALAVVTALNIALLCSLSQNHRAVGAQAGANAPNPALKPIAGEPARDFLPQPRPQQLIVLDDKAGASASLRFAADSAGIGGDPVISYLRDSPSGPVLLLSGFPAGTAIRFLSSATGQPRRNCSAVSYWNLPFPSGGEQFSPATMICIAGGSGRVVLNTVQNPSNGQIGVFVNWSADLNMTGPKERLQLPGSSPSRQLPETPRPGSGGAGPALGDVGGSQGARTAGAGCRAFVDRPRPQKRPAAARTGPTTPTTNDSAASPPRQTQLDAHVVHGGGARMPAHRSVRAAEMRSGWV